MSTISLNVPSSFNNPSLPPSELPTHTPPGISVPNSATPSKSQFENHTQSPKFQQALNTVADLGLSVEICGTWIWASGRTLQADIDALAVGFCWSSRKGSWYFRSEDKQRTSVPHTLWSMDQIRNKYGSDRIQADQQPNGAAG